MLLRESLCNRRFVITCASGTLVAGLLSFYSAVHPVKASGRSTIAPATPFSAVVVLSVFDPEGKLAVKSTWDYYRFTDGSFATRNSRQIEPKPGPFMDDITDLRSHEDITLEPVTKSAITINRDPREQVSEIEGEWDENCPGEDDDLAATEPGELFFGQPTVHVTKQFDRYWKQDRWMVRELRCFSVKQIDVNGPSRNERLVTSLTLGEPPQSALSPPEGFVERSPAEAAKAYALATGGDQLFVPQALEKLTKQYEAGRKRP